MQKHQDGYGVRALRKEELNLISLSLSVTNEPTVLTGDSLSKSVGPV